VLSMGGAALGIFAVGGLAIGGLSLGGGALGVVAIGGLAAGYIAAEGGLAIAQQFALGGDAFALHANDAAARQFFQQYKWLDMTRPEIRNLFTTICWLPMLLVFWRVRQMRRARKESQAR
jgi:hypothetical protein